MFHVKHRRDRFDKFEIEEEALLDQALAALQAYGVEIPAGAAQQLIRFAELVRQANQSTQLVSRRDEGKIIQRHIVESLAVPTAVSFDFENILDLGTGAGFPGVPLAILYPDKQFTLLDSKRKKILFLRRVQKALRLENVHILQSRIEDLEPTTGFDAVLARAVADLRTLWDWARPHVAPSGVMLAMKGGDLTDEVEMLKKAAPDLQVSCRPYTMPLLDEKANRKLVIIKKTVQ